MSDVVAWASERHLTEFTVDDVAAFLGVTPRVANTAVSWLVTEGRVTYLGRVDSERRSLFGLTGKTAPLPKTRTTPRVRRADVPDKQAVYVASGRRSCARCFVIIEHWTDVTKVGPEWTCKSCAAV